MSRKVPLCGLERPIHLCRYVIFVVRDQYLRSLLPHGDQTIAGNLKNMFSSQCLFSLRHIWRPGFKYSLCFQNVIINFAIQEGAFETGGTLN